ncbi:MAG: FitA-like ribbon-helix-helix domain-containing protein [Acidiphilium sp.]
MSAVNVRNLSEATHRALRLRAARHGRSTEAEIRAILDAAVRPALGLGSRLAAIGREFGGVELGVARDTAPPESAVFE